MNRIKKKKMLVPVVLVLVLISQIMLYAYTRPLKPIPIYNSRIIGEKTLFIEEVEYTYNYFVTDGGGTTGPLMKIGGLMASTNESMLAGIYDVPVDPTLPAIPSTDRYIWSVSGSPHVTIEKDSGVLTVYNDSEPGDITIKATKYDNPRLSCKLIVSIIKKEPNCSITIYGKQQIELSSEEKEYDYEYISIIHPPYISGYEPSTTELDFEWYIVGNTFITITQEGTIKVPPNTPLGEFKIGIRLIEYPDVNEELLINIVKEIDRIHSFSLETIKGSEYTLGITSENIKNNIKTTYTIEYNPDMLEVKDLIGSTYANEMGNELTSEISFITIEEGKLVFVFNKEVENNMTWSGIVNSIKFKAISNGNTEVTLIVE